MEETVLFPSPNWFQTSGFVVTCDGWMIYGGPTKSLCALEPIPAEKDGVLLAKHKFRAHVVTRAHFDKITCLAVSPEWPEKKDILAGSADGMVKQWTLEPIDQNWKLKATQSHEKHHHEKEEVAGVAYSHDSYAVTVGCFGNIWKWDIKSNVVKHFKHLKAFKPTCISCSPHIPLNVAIGTRQGVVFVLDLTGAGKVMYKVRGQDDEITALSWCPQYEVLVKKALGEPDVHLDKKEKKGKVSVATQRMMKIRELTDKEKLSISETNTQEKAGEESDHETKEVEVEIEDVKVDSEVFEEDKDKANVLEDSGIVKSLPEDSFDETVVQEDDMFDIYKDHEADEFGHKKYEPEEILVKIKDEKVQADYLDDCMKLKEEILRRKNQQDQSMESLVKALDDAHIQKTEEMPSHSQTQVSDDAPSEDSKSIDNNAKDQKERVDHSVHVQKHMLASVGKYGSIRIWSKSGKLVGSGVTQYVANKNQRSKPTAWTTVLWYKADVLLIGDCKSQLLECDPLKIDCKNKLSYRTHQQLHRRGLFCLATAAPRVQTPDQSYEHHVWTAGQDRNIVCYDVVNKKPVATYATCGGFVYDVKACPYDAGKIAVSVSDGAVRVWDTETSEDDQKLIAGSVNMYWQHVQGKVLCVAWHPSRENLLAFATGESRVGLIDTHAKSENNARNLLSSLNGGIYSLCWGEDNDLYACGGGALVVYNASKLDDAMSQRNAKNMVPALRVKQSPKGSLRTAEDAVLLEHTPGGSRLRVWKPATTPEMSPSPSTSASRKPVPARPSLLRLDDDQMPESIKKFLFLMDSGSEVEPDSDDDGSDVETAFDFRAERTRARNLREEAILSEEGCISDGMDDSMDDGMCERVMADEVKAEKVMDEQAIAEQPMTGMAYEGLIAIGADEQVDRVLDEERILNTGDDESVEQPTLAQEYADLDVFSWSDDFSTFSGQAETYLRIPGPMLGCQEPDEIFREIWDDDIMASIAKETNNYAWSCIAPLTEQPNSLPGYLAAWTEVTVPELYRYFTVLIFMSLCLRSKVNEYWRTDILEMHKFRQIMSRDRFILITKFLHFVNNDDIDLRLSNYDKKIHKIRPILDHCNKKFASLYVPNKHLSLDESLLLWKGRLSWVQCIRTKAARFGIKSYELCEAVTGYQLRCLIYAGKESTMTEEPIHGFENCTAKVVPELMDGFENCTAKVVLELMDGFLNVGHTLVMDNWYNQLPLARFLKKRKTDVIGTLNPRRFHVPDDIKFAKNKNLQKGQQIARHCGDVSLVAWKDVKLVTAMSTCHGDRQLPARRAGQDITKPETIVEYNKFMGGVDSKDQKLSMFLMERKRGRKWYMKVFKRLVNTSILNAFIIYRKHPVTKVLSHRDFRMALALGLLQKFSPQPQSSLPPTNLEIVPRRLMAGESHFVIYTSAQITTGKSRHKQLRCVRCTAAGKRTMVQLMCNFCQVPLCPGPCWADYHTLPNLK